MTAPVAIVLAAGKSTRMKSALPKVLHEVGGRPMVEYVLDAARSVGVQRLVVIVGHAADQVRSALAHQSGVEFALQAEQKGTGHAVMQAHNALRNHQGPVLVLTGDAPLMRAESFAALLADQAEHRASCVIGTAETEHNFGLGRIVRGRNGQFEKIVEQKDANPDEQAIREINVGCYVFDCQRLFWALERIQPNNAQKELYLTDCCAILKNAGDPVVASCRLDITEALGVNTRAELARVHQALQDRTFARLMTDGVTIVDPRQTVIDSRARIGVETVIEPFTTIAGAAEIGRDCRIGPHVHLGPNARLPDGARVPPFTAIG
ncbi:MAG: NTP transferase domain-containing protein [Planctomycetaceae bacterium]